VPRFRRRLRSAENGWCSSRHPSELSSESGGNRRPIGLSRISVTSHPPVSVLVSFAAARQNSSSVATPLIATCDGPRTFVTSGGETRKAGHCAGSHALRPSARSEPAAGNCSNKRAIQRFRMRAFAAGQAGTTLDEARSATLQARCHHSVQRNSCGTHWTILESLGPPGPAIDDHLTSLRTKRSLPHGANRTAVTHRALCGP
jgi:hypothetical protein